MFNYILASWSHITKMVLAGSFAWFLILIIPAPFVAIFFFAFMAIFNAVSVRIQQFLFYISGVEPEDGPIKEKIYGS